MITKAAIKETRIKRYTNTQKRMTTQDTKFTLGGVSLANDHAGRFVFNVN